MQKLEQTQKFQHNYYSAKLTKGKIWYVSYYVRNPCTQELESLRIKVNRIKNLKDHNIYCKNLIIDINNKLHSDWNPYIQENVAVCLLKKNKKIALETRAVNLLRKSFVNIFTVQYTSKFDNIIQNKYTYSIVANTDTIRKRIASEFFNITYLANFYIQQLNLVRP